jgi:arylsulfatase A-like enzyme
LIPNTLNNRTNHSGHSARITFFAMLKLLAPTVGGRLLVAVLAALLIGNNHGVAASNSLPPNFLFIAIDDLNDFSGFAAEEPGNFLQKIYPDATVRAKVKQRLTPHLDRLAAQSAPFLRSYCPSALCGPSRTSLMTGVPPHQSGYYMHDRHFRLYDTLKGAITLPQQLKRHGYFTTGIGKLFHRGVGTVAGPVAEDWADAQHSWHEWVNHPNGCNGGQPGKYSPPDGGLMQFGPSRLATKDSGDWLTADFTARLLEQGTATTTMSRGSAGPQTVILPKDKPFFIGCGLFRPHLPFYAPPEFFDRFPVAEMTGLDRAALDAIIADLEDLPPGARRFSDFDNGKMKLVMEHARRVGGEAAEIPAWRDLVQSYLACVAFADACVGRLLEGLENSPFHTNTVVVLWSDHGFHVGSKYHIAKQALWEEANRTTLLIRDPRQAAACDGKPRRQIVSLNDLYPTICDLAGVPLPQNVVVGKSLRPLLRDAAAPPIHEALLMTYMEGNHSLRTANHRFMRYRDGSVELYNINEDPAQLRNLARVAASANLIAKFNAELEQRVKGEIRGEGNADAQEENVRSPRPDRR